MIPRRTSGLAVFAMLFLFIFFYQSGGIIRATDLKFAGANEENFLKNFLVFVNHDDYLQLEDSLLQFKRDVESKFSVNIKILAIINLRDYQPDGVRKILIDECDIDASQGCKKLEGALFIGEVPYALYDQIYWYYNTAPFMFYYQDLDATFQKRENGHYFKYESFGIHEGPEIYISWIKPLKDQAVGSSIEQLKKYFDKHHRFFSGEIGSNGKVIVAIHCDTDASKDKTTYELFKEGYDEEKIIEIHPHDGGCDNLEPVKPELLDHLSQSPEVAYLHSHGSPLDTWNLNKNDILSLPRLPLFLYSWGCGNGNFYYDETRSFALSFINGNDLGLTYIGKLDPNDIIESPLGAPECVACRFINNQQNFFRYWNSGVYIGKALFQVMSDFVDYEDPWYPEKPPLNLYRISGPLQRIIIGSPFIQKGPFFSPSPTPTGGISPTIPPPILGDFNSDGKVGDLDLDFLLNKWGSSQADLTQDGETDEKDLTVLLSGWKPRI